MEYNGWQNYATWRVYTDFFQDDGFRKESGVGPEDVLCPYAMMASVRRYVETKASYADGFLDQVDWEEVANNAADDILTATH